MIAGQANFSILHHFRNLV